VALRLAESQGEAHGADAEQAVCQFNAIARAPAVLFGVARWCNGN